MSKTKKVKAVSFRVPADREEANRMIAALGEAQRERSTIETEMNAEIEAVKARFENRAISNAARIAELTRGIQAFCEARRDELTANGKRKTHAFLAGVVAWRTRPPSVTLRGVEKILADLKRLRLSRFTRTKVSVDKDAMLKEPDLARQISGVSIASTGEDFSITPTETSLEEVI